MENKNLQIWPTKKILEACAFERGTEPGSDAYNMDGEGVFFIRVGNIAAQIQKQIYTTSKNVKLCKKDDILIALDGSPGVVIRNMEGAYSSGIRKVVLKDTKKVFYDFIYYVLQTDSVQNVIREHSIGITIKHASKSLDYIKIPLPPLLEQKRIVYILDAIQEAIGIQKKIIEKIQELKRTMMKKFFTEGMYSEKLKETEIGKMPKSWKIIKLERALSTKINYKVGELKQKDFQHNGQFPIIDQSKDFIAGYSNDMGKVYRGVLPVIIFGDHTRVVKYVNFPFIVGGSGVKVLIPNNEEFEMLFFFYAINNLKLPSRGYNRHFKFLKDKFIPKPKLHEQREIAEIFQTIDQKIEIEQKKKTLYEELFKTMLNKLINREIQTDNLRI